MFRKTAKSPNATKETSAGCLSLFGLPFFLAGLVMSYFYFGGYIKSSRAQTWQEVPCRIESAKLVTGSKNSYRSTAVYHYQFAGRDYRSERVSLYGGSDNIGDFQWKAHQELSAHAEGKNDRMFRCYVNPADPAQAVIYRTLRWPMQAFLAVFALTFPAVGAGLLTAGLLAVREAKSEARLRAAHPDERWKWKTAWVGPAIPEDHSPLKMAVFYYTFWFWLVVAPLLATMIMTRAWEQNPYAWLALVLPVIGVIPTWSTLKRLRHRAAVGVTSLELKERPVSAGGTLRGIIRSARPLPSSGNAELTMECVKSEAVANGDGSSTKSEKLWSHQEILPLGAIPRGPDGSSVPVGFKLPLAPDSTLDRSETVKYRWNLHFKIPEAAIHSTFEIPVFTAGKFSTDEVVEAVELMPQVASGDLPKLLAARRIQATFSKDGLPQSIVCPPSRYLARIFILIVFNVTWSAVALMLFDREAPWLFRIVWSVSAAFIWLVIIRMALHKRSVSFGGEALTVTNQFGPVIWNRNHNKRDILAFKHDSNMTSGNQSFYQVKLESLTGRKEILVDNITESNTAAALCGLLEKWKQA